MSIKKRILIVGGSSHIGQALVKRLDPIHYQCILTSRNKAMCLHDESIKYLDLDDTNSFQSLQDENFDVCVFLAALTDTQVCEKYPELAQRINVENTKLLMHFLLDENMVSRLVFLSTNQVFDGTTPYPDIEQPIHPFNNYAQAKAEVENYLLALPNEVAIVRLTKVLCENDAFFESRVQDIARANGVSVFNDMYISPISIDLVVTFLNDLIDAKTLNQKIYQLSGQENYSYYDVLRFLALGFGLEGALVASESKHTKGIRSPEYASMAFNAGEFKGYQAPSLEVTCQALVSGLKDRLMLLSIVKKEKNYE